MKNPYFPLLLCATSALTLQGAPAAHFDLARFRYQKKSESIFRNPASPEIDRINSLLDSGSDRKAAPANPAPAITLPAANINGDLDAPNGETWYYTGDFVYTEIPPHDDVAYTDRILKEYTFTIYDSDMNQIGVIKDKMDYQEDEVRTVLCEITPVVTRNFFNTDDGIELMVALGVNRKEEGNNYRTLVYRLYSQPDAEGYNKPLDVYDDIVADVAQGPATEGHDNFYITFMKDTLEEPEAADTEDEEGTGFWDFLLSQKVEINIFGKATEYSGPKIIHTAVIPMIQLPGDQQDSPVMISTRHGDDLIYCFQTYTLPFYNRYDDPMQDDMTQREGNSLEVSLYKASETGLELFSTTEIPVVLDPMKDEAGDPTCLFSFFSVGNLGYSSDILFDAPGATAEKPDFIITRGNYQVSTDGIINSYFTYRNDGTLKNTLFLYADATLAMGDIKGFEPQQMFVSMDDYGYTYNFVDLYSAKTVSRIDAYNYYDEDSDPELLSANLARTPSGDSYQYVFELRYPLYEDGNDFLRFMYFDAEGKYDHIDSVNMGTNVLYAQSYLSTEALAPHAYSSSDTPAYMLLVKRGDEGADTNQEEVMVAEAVTEENPEGKTLLLLGPDGKGELSSIVPEFASAGNPGRLFIYYYDSDTRKYTLDVYSLPLADGSGIEEIAADNQDEYAGIVRVHSIDGRLVASGSNPDLSSLPAGTYIIAAGGKTVKILK